MAVRLRSKASEPVTLGEYDLVVNPGETVERPGELKSQSGDCYLVTTGRTVSEWVDDGKGNSVLKEVPELRAWPKSQWSLVDNTKDKKAEE